MLTPGYIGSLQKGCEAGRETQKDLAKLMAVLDLLIEQKALPAIYNDHPLKGSWRGFRDLHIEPDWLLLYRVEGDELQLARTGTHSDLFDE